MPSCTTGVADDSAGRTEAPPSRAAKIVPAQPANIPRFARSVDGFAVLRRAVESFGRDERARVPLTHRFVWSFQPTLPGIHRLSPRPHGHRNDCLGWTRHTGSRCIANGALASTSAAVFGSSLGDFALPGGSRGRPRPDAARRLSITIARRSFRRFRGGATTPKNQLRNSSRTPRQHPSFRSVCCRAPCH